MKKTIFALFLTVCLVLSTILPASALTGQVNSLLPQLPGLGDFETVVDSDLLEVLEGTTEPVEVIVTFWGDDGLTGGHLDLLEELGLTKGMKFESLPIAGVLATAAQVELLAALPEVRSIYLNSELEYYNKEANEITGVEKARTEREFRQNGLPVSGKGVTVLVNDSGVDGTHKDHEYDRKLIQNVLGSTNLNAYDEWLPVTYVEDVPNTDTNSGHGTHVAGTIAGTGAMSSGLYEGVAPGADLVGYGSGAVLLVLDGIGGFDYAITHQREYNIRVIANSWGSSGDFDPHHPINVASKKAYDRGMVVTFAAGNSGPSADTHNPYAKAPWVISVAAGDKDGKLADFSSRGVKGHSETFILDGVEWTWKDQPTITAPGVDIISTIPISPLWPLGFSEDIDPGHMPYYARLSGTSMANPHVAGIVALMLEANPTLSPDEVKQILQQTATNMPGYEGWEVGAGYVNAYAAVDAAINGRDYGATVNTLRSFNTMNADDLTDIVGHAAEDYIREAISNRLVDGFSNDRFRPDRDITRIEMAEYLTMGAGIRQYLPIDGSSTFSDVSSEQQVFAESVTVRGAALKDRAHQFSGVMLPTGEDTFSPNQKVTRAELAYTIVQSLGLQEEAQAFDGETVTVQYAGETIAVKDADDIPSELRGYVQLALDKGLLNATFSMSQGPYDLEPTLSAQFNPETNVTRAEFAVAMTRFVPNYR